MPPKLVELESLARQAGEILHAGFRSGHHVYSKGANDLVTDIDRQSEAFLLSEIKRRFPNDGVIAEESGGVAGGDCCLWYVDPLDGTVNFAHGVPIFSVSIAYAEEGRVRLGVVYDPLRDECFSAERGAGAWLNGAPIRPTSVSRLADSLLVTGFPYDIQTTEQDNLAQFAAFSLRAQGVRRLGSAALDLCYVAAGRLDGYWELYLEPYDLAAGALIASEAGAMVSAADGEADYLSQPCSILAAPAPLHAQMLQVLRQV